jgi:signal transduction histidine kinase
MVRDLLSFSREEKLRKEDCDINSVISEAAELAGKQFEQNPGIVLRLDLAGGLPQLCLDKHKMIRVFNNIMKNGMQAIEEHTRQGTVTVSTSLDTNNITVIITDTGPGIPEENIARIFDPFFTTKKESKGTGLGLSLCHEIITRHGGTITANSEHGNGATFTIQLPTE